MKLNTTRVWLGGIAGGVVWSAWSFFVGWRQGPLYEAMQKQGLFLKESRYPFFAGHWILLIFVMSILVAYLYAWSRTTVGAGPKTALKIGMIVGFCAGVPGNFAQAAWSPVPRMLPLGWMLDLWVGAILAAVVARVFCTRIEADGNARTGSYQGMPSGMPRVLRPWERLHRLRKNSGFVSGHRFSDAASPSKSATPLGAAGRKSILSAAYSGRGISLD